MAIVYAQSFEEYPVTFWPAYTPGGFVKTRCTTPFGQVPSSIVGSQMMASCAHSGEFANQCWMTARTLVVLPGYRRLWMSPGLVTSGHGGEPRPLEMFPK